MSHTPGPLEQAAYESAQALFDIAVSNPHVAFETRNEHLQNICTALNMLGQALEALERLTDPDKVMIDPHNSYPSFCRYCGHDGPEKETVYDSASCEHHSVDCPYIAARRVLRKGE